MLRRSAKRICLPNGVGDGATSHAIPRDRRRPARSMLTCRSSSETSATSTALGTGRELASRPFATSGTTLRDTPNEMPTPG